MVVNADFHGGNVLRATREPWLAIDPKPLAGEREFFPVSLLRDRRDELLRDPDPQRRVRRRLDQLTDALGLERERMRGGAVAHALAGAGENWGSRGAQVACARWLLHA